MDISSLTNLFSCGRLQSYISHACTHTHTQIPSYSAISTAPLDKCFSAWPCLSLNHDEMYRASQSGSFPVQYQLVQAEEREREREREREPCQSLTKYVHAVF